MTGVQTCALPIFVVVEDEPAIRRGVSDALRLSGYEVTEAPDGVAGLREADAAGVDLVLLELFEGDQAPAPWDDSMASIAAESAGTSQSGLGLALAAYIGWGWQGMEAVSGIEEERRLGGRQGSCQLG